MKKLILSMALLLVAITAAAQLSTANGTVVTTTNNIGVTLGNVGIGTSTPSNALTVQKVSGGSGASGTDGTGGVRVNWSSGYGVALDAWDVNEPRWGLTSFTGNTPTVIFEGKYSSKDSYFNSGGNLGIGTTSPAALLDIQKTYGNDVGIKLSQPGSAIWDIKNTGTSGLFTIGAGGGTYFNIDKTNGNVGIGDTNPLTKFVIKDSGQAFYFLTNQKLVGTFPATPEATTMTLTSSGNSAGNLAFATGNSEAMRITNNGKVGIGTTNPDEKLTVKGKIHAEEIIVDLAVPADYVFQKYYTGKSELKTDYVMPTLAEIESFTTKNHHLPNVPSAQVIKQNGLSLGEMSNVLLQKVEELTLYAIEQNKQIERLKAENDKYKSLSERLSTIENQLKK
jgi:hypothetical protein